VGVIDAGIGEKGLDRDHSDQMLPCFGTLEDWIDLRPVENAQACAFEKIICAGKGHLHDELFSAGGSIK